MKRTSSNKIPLIVRDYGVPSHTGAISAEPNEEPTQERTHTMSNVSSMINVASVGSVNSAFDGLEGQSTSSISIEAYESESFPLSEPDPSLGSWCSALTEYAVGSTYSQESLEVPRGESSPKPPSETNSSLSERKVCVLVKDAGRNAEKTFYCTCSMLVTYMPFFEERFKEVSPDGDVEISIHVDLVVFEKLMAYVSQAMEGDEQNYKIDPDYAIHLLVAADFLYMSSLVDKCLDYCHRHLSSIVQANSPLGAMTDPLIEQLAARFNHRELEALEDPKDRIKGKLYKKLLDKLLIPEDESPGQPGTPKLFRCSLCEQIFATKLQYNIPCKHKKRALGPHGQLVYYHKRDTNWSLEQYLEEQLESAESWRRVYWRVWGLVSRLYCVSCEKEFCCADFTRCRYHKEPLQFPPTEGEQSSLHQLGTFPCCGRTSYRFDPIDPLHVEYGCCYKNHTVSSEERPGSTFQDMLSYYDLMYQTRSVELNSFEYSGLQRIVPIFSEKTVNDWSVLLNHGTRVPKPRKVTPKKSGSGEMIAEVFPAGPEPFVSVLSSLTVPSKAFNIKPAWKMRTAVWYNQDVIREHDNAVMERLMAQLQKTQPATRTRHSSRK